MSVNNNVRVECPGSGPCLCKVRVLCHALVRDAKKAGISTHVLHSVYDSRKWRENEKIRDFDRKYKRLFILLAGVALGLALVVVWGEVAQVGGARCLVRNNYIVQEATRPLAPCRRICKGANDSEGFITLGNNITREEFARFAYLSRPIVVRGGASHWPAIHTFSETFFRSLYDNVDGSYEAVAQECQFLPFRSRYLTLHAALSDQKRPLHWYFGWSNCSPGVGIVLRELAPRPSFLPTQSEHSALDWIFMGTHGPGAAWHLDYVQRPSWQAQIRGSKTWHLRPVPECNHICTPISLTVHRGDIVFVDTNQWYHTTVIHPGDISMTIGSEYD